MLTNENALNFKTYYATNKYYNDIHKYHVLFQNEIIIQEI